MTDDTDTGEPSEYAGRPRNLDNRRTPTGRAVPKSTAELARDMRREGLREAAGQKAEPHRAGRWER